MEILGLENAPELNGLIGTLASVNASYGLCIVKERDSNEEFEVKTHNVHARGRSISREGMARIVYELALEASQASVAWSRKTDGGKRVTSHDLRAVFMNRVDPDSKVSKLEVVPGAAPFHPYDRHPQLYSCEAPDAVIIYTWKSCLVTELPRFLDRIERELEGVLGRKPRCSSARQSVCRACQGPGGKARGSAIVNLLSTRRHLFCTADVLWLPCYRALASFDPVAVS